MQMLLRTNLLSVHQKLDVLRLVLQRKIRKGTNAYCHRYLRVDAQEVLECHGHVGAQVRGDGHANLYCVICKFNNQMQQKPNAADVCAGVDGHNRVTNAANHGNQAVQRTLEVPGQM